MNASLNSKRPTGLFVRWLVLIIMVSMLIGCKTANYGMFKLNHAYPVVAHSSVGFYFPTMPIFSHSFV